MTGVYHTHARGMVIGQTVREFARWSTRILAHQPIAIFTVIHIETMASRRPGRRAAYVAYTRSGASFGRADVLQPTRQHLLPVGRCVGYWGRLLAQIQGSPA